MKHPDAMVTFPLSPTRILMMDNRHSEPDTRYYPLQGGPGAFNLMWRNAIDQMFAPRHATRPPVWPSQRGEVCMTGNRRRAYRDLTRATGVH